MACRVTTIRYSYLPVFTASCSHCKSSNSVLREQAGLISFSKMTLILDSRVLQLTDGSTLAEAAYDDCHNNGPCFHLCEDPNFGTHCGMGHTLV